MRILIIEDDPEIAVFVRSVLDGEGQAVDVAATARSGRDIAMSEPYDLVILDLNLPDRDGLDVLSELRRSAVPVPVLILTARGEVSDRVAGLDGGADDYLVKPFAVAELHARVRALLRRHGPERSPILEAGPLRMDTTRREATIDGHPVELTRREMAILEYLMLNKGRLLSKGMIAEHVWDYRFNSDLNLIEVYIRRLRTRIAERTDERLIHTIRNGGYVIRDPES